ncbi:MAG: hypothetical protein Q4D60_05890 [Eubacteriales bacterium]|nr:hypothetical protein [Eubacteriales bacterium]
MSEKKENMMQEEVKENELDLDELDQVSGGGMRGKIVITKTTDISEDTKANI